MSLFERVGGADGIAAAVDRFYELMLADDRVSSWFDGIQLERLKAHQRAFLAVGLGGPEEYDGRSIRVAHSGLAITTAAFDASIENLASALREVGASDADVVAVTKRIRALQAAIVEVR